MSSPRARMILTCKIEDGGLSCAITEWYKVGIAPARCVCTCIFTFTYRLISQIRL